ncbi:MAG: cytochrome c-type biogenesis protein CcmH [Gammaproteobacteria bacterium]|nr:cytochrome c-type biogenesis protein CcmH [Gammaproteobacteria bacterium]
MIRAGLVLAGLLLFGAVDAGEPGLVAEDPDHRQMLEVAKQLRCAVCQNQSVAESNSGLAEDMRAVITEKLAEGESEQAVLDYFVARYGGYILMKPESQGKNWLLWWSPLVVLLLVLGLGYRFLRGQRVVPPAPPGLSDAERAAVARARAGLEE